jgi:hypothetical protein
LDIYLRFSHATFNILLDRSLAYDSIAIVIVIVIVAM